MTKIFLRRALSNLLMLSSADCQSKFDRARLKNIFVIIHLWLERSRHLATMDYDKDILEARSVEFALAVSRGQHEHQVKKSRAVEGSKTMASIVSTAAASGRPAS